MNHEKEANMKFTEKEPTAKDYENTKKSWSRTKSGFYVMGKNSSDGAYESWLFPDFEQAAAFADLLAQGDNNGAPQSVIIAKIIGTVCIDKPTKFIPAGEIKNG
jgi:hypothetical protein